MFEERKKKSKVMSYHHVYIDIFSIFKIVINITYM